MAFSDKIRIGVDTLKIDAYGGVFSAATDLGDVAEEGVTVGYTTAYKKLACAQRPTLKEILEIGPQELFLECLLQLHKMAHLALSFGQATADVTIDSVSSPKTESIGLGGNWKPNDYFAIQLKSKQIVAPTLFDIVTLYRVKVIAAFNQVHTIKQERFIPVRFECTEDSSNTYKYGKFLSEWA